MVKTVDIKMWLSGIFPSMTPITNERTTADIIADIAKVDAKIAQNEQRLRDAVIRMVSMGRLAEGMLITSYPRADEAANTMLEAYRSILMEEYHIAEEDLIPADKVLQMAIDGELG
jgi:hypothetical protein